MDTTTGTVPFSPPTTPRASRRAQRDAAPHRGRPFSFASGTVRRRRRGDGHGASYFKTPDRTLQSTTTEPLGGANLF
jgi:hypothetical protein